MHPFAQLFMTRAEVTLVSNLTTVRTSRENASSASICLNCAFTSRHTSSGANSALHYAAEYVLIENSIK